MQEISSHCDSGQRKPIAESSLRLGTPCIARYSVDGRWYRAIVESASINHVGVYFVDYGNREDVFPTEVLEIRPQFMSLPAQGIVCSPAGAGVWSGQMRESFFEWINGCDLLQAVFVQKRGKTVDVILSDIADPVGVSFNERLGLKLEKCCDAFSIKPVVKQQVSQTETLKVRISSHGYKRRVLSPQTCADVLVSWFVSPDVFYCQDLSFENDFQDLSKEIQESRQDLSPVRGDISVGTPVIANYPADGVLYRGEIKEQKGEMSYLVEYVDYGNSEVVTLSDLWNMEPRFLSLPRHAILCSLEGVKPANSVWSPDLKDYVDVFGAEMLKCVFYKLQDGKYNVGLFLQDESVATRLVQGHLAQECELEESQFDLELLPGQQLPVHIVFIESVSKFYVHLDPLLAEEIQDNITSYVQAKNLFPSDNLDKYSLCLASPDGVSWYRAKILNVSSQRGVLVKFVDYGNSSEVPLHQVLRIPEPLTDYCPQATECFITLSDQLIDDLVEEQFKTVEDQDVIIFVDSLSAGRLGVQVFSLDGLQLEMLNSPLLVVEPVCPMPVKNRIVSVSVSHVDGPQDVWLQSTASEQQLITLLDLLHKFYEIDAAGQVLDTPQEGDLCAARFTKDDSWYRARVKSVGENGVSVLFIDYGNCDVVPFESVKVLDPSFFTPHALSLCASLPVKCDESLLERVFTATFRKDFSGSGAWLVNLLEADRESGLSVAKEAYSSVQLPRGKITVHLSCFESPSDFYVQPASLCDAIIDFQQNLNDAVDSLEHLDKPFASNMLCVAQFPFDCRWYRALIMESGTSLVKVHFVDYGNVEEIDITHHSLKVLPKEQREKPFFAVRCSLKAEDLANSKVVSLLENLALNHEQVIEIEVLDSRDPVTIQLVVPGQEEVGVKTDDKCIVKCESFTWHVTTPAEFWIQDDADLPLLDEIGEKLAEAASFPALKSIEEGQLCAALFPENELWYRARILKVSRKFVHVRYIDYGNSSLSSELRILPADLVQLPPVAKYCQVMLPDIIYPRSLDGIIKLELEPLVAQTKTENTIFTSECSGSESKESYEVSICHITSSTSFWVHFTEDIPLLRDIASKLQLCDKYDPVPEPTKGTICAALFPEDELWYRAEILSLNENGIEVFFIDYGNSSLSPDVRLLPVEVLEIPGLAKHCYLKLPEAWPSWPLAAEELFLNFCEDDSKRFQLTIVEKGDPACVILSHDGICIEDVLGSL
ncbi:tudor domain-containing protein 1 [Anabrus simplex]|uniref:tudor domain-containing protein 1 n=1 Tax=Anabrus simplex TaxID=316456 RepID=UPI0035A2A91B